MQKYKYDILKLEAGKEADIHNDSLLGPGTLGIEVTNERFAARCGLGNIDTQHGADGSDDSSAILESIEWPLPPDGSTFVTIRPDADAFVAMAVFATRADGNKNKLNYELLELVNAVDNFGYATAIKRNPEFGRYKIEFDAIQQIVKNSGNKWPAIQERVRAIYRIITDAMPVHEMSAIADLRTVSNIDGLKLHTVVTDRVMLIRARGQYGVARAYGQTRFPVTVVYDDEYILPGAVDYKSHKRWCVIKANDVNCFDMLVFKRLINEAEAKAHGIGPRNLEERGLAWGGPKNLMSSPQGKESVLNETGILNVVKMCVL